MATTIRRVFGFSVTVPHAKCECGNEWHAQTGYCKLPDPTAKAREIAENIVLESRQDRFAKATIWLEHLTELLAAAIEAERKAGREETHCKVNCGCFADMRAKQVGDAEGYRRGLEEAAEVAEKTSCGATYPNSDECECYKEVAAQIRQRGQKYDY